MANHRSPEWFFRLRWALDDESSFPKTHQRLLKRVWCRRAIFPNLDLNNRAQVMLFRLGYSGALEHGTYRKKVDQFMER